MAWRPDGQQLATASDDGSARVWEAASGQPISLLEGQTGAAYAVAWSPDGQHLATASADGTARVWEAATGQSLSLLEGHTDFVYSVAWSPDGRRLATAGEDVSARLWLTDPLLIAALTERACNVLNLDEAQDGIEDEIVAVIPEWEGCEFELEKVAADLEAYHAIMDARTAGR